MHRLIFGLLLAFSMMVARAENPARPSRPIPAIERVLIVSIDGLRPDCVLRAEAPTLRELMRTGAFTFWARTTAVAITLPSHTSMLTGATPAKHGVSWNGDLPPGAPAAYPGVPTIFELAKRAGYSTGMIAGKSKFAALNKPGTLDVARIPAAGQAGSDAQVASQAVALIGEGQPDLLFLHFPGVDGAGHAKGWGSPEQLAQIEKTDAELGRVLAAMATAGTRASTLVIVSADHGGAGLTHGADDARSRHIPWIAAGPGVRADFDLTRVPGVQVNTEDTAATAAYVLGFALPDNSDGHAVRAAFEGSK